MSSSGTWQLTALNRSGRCTGDGAHQQAAVAAALDAQVARARHLRRDQVFGDGDEVVVAALACARAARPGARPGRTRRRRGCWRRPRRRRARARPCRCRPSSWASARSRSRRSRTAASGCGRRACRALRPDDEVGHARAVPGRRELLLDAHACRIEEVRTRLQQLALVAAGVREVQRVRRQEVGVAEEVGLGQRVVGRVRVVQLGRRQRAGERRLRRRGAASRRPSASLLRCGRPTSSSTLSSTLVRVVP